MILTKLTAGYRTYFTLEQTLDRMHQWTKGVNNP